jgi:hypothetical protein
MTMQVKSLEEKLSAQGHLLDKAECPVDPHLDAAAKRGAREGPGRGASKCSSLSWSGVSVRTNCIHYVKSRADSCVTMISCGVAVTGGVRGHVYLWDLRHINRGFVHEYQAFGPERRGNQLVSCVAVDPRHHTLLAGGSGGIVSWDLQTGALPPA